uniref:Uncharacterized protein n=1 Tax=Zea mays TaxID=4577 RepID=A0A804MLP3_MAIZE
MFLSRQALGGHKRLHYKGGDGVGAKEDQQGSRSRAAGLHPADPSPSTARAASRPGIPCLPRRRAPCSPRHAAVRASSRQGRAPAGPDTPPAAAPAGPSSRRVRKPPSLGRTPGSSPARAARCPALWPDRRSCNRRARKPPKADLADPARPAASGPRPDATPRLLPLLPPDRAPAPSPPAAGAARGLSPSAPAPPDPPRLASSPSPSAGVQPTSSPCSRRPLVPSRPSVCREHSPLRPPLHLPSDAVGPNS